MEDRGQAVDGDALRLPQFLGGELPGRRLDRRSEDGRGRRRERVGRGQQEGEQGEGAEQLHVVKNLHGTPGPRPTASCKSRMPKAPGGSRWDDAWRSALARSIKCPAGDGSRHPARFREGLSVGEKSCVPFFLIAFATLISYDNQRI